MISSERILVRNEYLKKVYKSIFKLEFLKICLINKNLDLILIEQLAFFYTLFGYKMLDIDYNPEAIIFIENGINRALKRSDELSLNINKKPILCFSFYLTNKNHQEILKKIRLIISNRINIDIIEIHLRDTKLNIIFDFIKEINNDIFPYIFSISITRDKLSNSSIEQVTKEFFNKVTNNIILEVDVFNEETEKLNNTLQVLSTADIINKEIRSRNLKFKKIPLIITSNKGSEIKNLAKQCSIEFDGLSFKNHIISINQSNLFEYEK